jgi:hypothetical protein
MHDEMNLQLPWLMFASRALGLAIAPAGRYLPFATLIVVAHVAHAAELNHVTFTDTTPLSGNAELTRRMLSPLTALELKQTLAHSGKILGEQPIDLTNESFSVYVPSTMPPSGFGLLVFVPPWDDARLPDGWASVLDQFGLIFVSAAHSGNSASDLGRREPLALAAEENIRKRQRVDAARIFVAGFSGGSPSPIRTYFVGRFSMPEAIPLAAAKCRCHLVTCCGSFSPHRSSYTSRVGQTGPHKGLTESACSRCGTGACSTM